MSLQVDTSQIRPDVPDMLAVRDDGADVQLHSTIDNVQPRLLFLGNSPRGHRVNLDLHTIFFTGRDRTCPGAVLRRLNAVAFQGRLFRAPGDALIEGMCVSSGAPPDSSGSAAWRAPG